MSNLPLEPIRSLVEQLSGLQTVWRDKAQPQVGADASGILAYIELTITDYGSIGTDEYRASYDATEDKLTATTCGNRKITVSMRCTSNDWCVQPADVLEVVRAQLRSTTAHAAYAAGNFALIRTLGLHVLSMRLDARTGLVSVLDVLFGFATNLTVTDEDGNYIEKINGGTSTSPIAPIPVTAD